MKETNKQIEIGDILEGRISANSSGSAYLTSIELPKDIYIHKNNTNHALHLDSVKVRVIDGIGRALEGEVIEIIQRFKEEYVGVVQISPRYAFFIPDSHKLSIDFYIPLDKLMGAEDGQKVIAKITNWSEAAKNPNGEIVKILGNAGEHETEIHSILEEYGLPYDFEHDVIAEANIIPITITQKEIDKRRDMRGILTFTIDPKDAKDFDDALSVEWVDGELIVGVHIADVSHYLRPDTELDKEAFNRGTSVYLVDRCVPMLPENLSNGLCSLRPNEDKLCFSVVFKLDRTGQVIEEWFGKTVINSNHRFTYEEAQAVIEMAHHRKDDLLGHEMFMEEAGLAEKAKGNDLSWVEANALAESIKALDRYAKMMRKTRFKHGAISLDKHEVKFELDEDNKPVDIIFKVGKDSNKLIEEFMLLANRKVAEFINKKGLPCVNRTHDKPNQEKLEHLREFIKQFGYEIKINTHAEISKTLNQLLIDVQGKVEANMIENLVVRTMQKASYSTKNIGHYGLGFKDYAHFTSPIRRYPDVMLHRLLNIYLDGSKTLPKIDKIESKCVYLAEREKKAQKAERDSIKYMQCIYMSDFIGKIFKGVISSITDFGIFVSIPENGCDVFLKMSEIKGTWNIDANNYCVKEYNTGETISLGDNVNIVITHVDIEKKNIDATLIRL